MVRVKLFASFREKFGSEMEVKARSVKELLEKLGIEDAVVAVNFEVVNGDAEIKDGDEVAVMPSFNGG